MAHLKTPRMRVLLIAESANPEWVSVPLVGWSEARALRAIVDTHLVTQIRNHAAIERAGWKSGEDFTALDSEAIARPLSSFGRWLKARTGLGWTTGVALNAFSYYYFEHLVWQQFGGDIAAGRYDLVHRLTPLTPTTPSLLASHCRRAGVPFVWGPINGGVPWPPGYADVLRAEGEWLSYFRGGMKLMPYYRSTRRDAAAIIVASQATWGQLADYHDKCVYIPENGVDSERFTMQARPVIGDQLRVAFVGRLVPYKGADILIEAAAPLIRSGKIDLDIIGDGPQLPQLRAMVEREGVGNGVKLDGWQEHAAVAERLAQSQVFACPSIREFGGGVVLEAMALGLVPVVVDYAGPAELVTDQTGFRIKIGKRAELVQSFRDTLANLWEQRGTLSEMGGRARARVIENFTWPAKAAQIVEVYEWVLGRASKPDFGRPIR
jgi:starch synthase